MAADDIEKMTLKQLSDLEGRIAKAQVSGTRECQS